MQSESETEERELELPKFARPWPRYWAKSLDLGLFAAFVDFVGGWILKQASPGWATTSVVAQNDYILGWVFLPFAVVMESLVGAVFGNTPGKFVAGIQVRTFRGEKPSIGTLLQRNFGVWFFGLGTGFPLVALFTLVHCHGKSKRGQTQRWDEAVGTRCFDSWNSLGSTTLTAALFVTLYVGLSLFGIQMEEREQQYQSNPLQLYIDASQTEVGTMLDEITRLDEVSLRGVDTLLHRYSLPETPFSEIDVQYFSEAMTEHLQTGTCSRTDLGYVIDAGAIFAFVYYASDGERIAEISFRCTQ